MLYLLSVNQASLIELEKFAASCGTLNMPYTETPIKLPAMETPLEKFAARCGTLNMPYTEAPIKLSAMETPQTPRPLPTPPTPAQQIAPTMQPGHRQKAKKRLNYSQVSLMNGNCKLCSPINYKQCY
jgi:hypothetical protein